MVTVSSRLLGDLKIASVMEGEDFWEVLFDTERRVKETCLRSDHTAEAGDGGRVVEE